MINITKSFKIENGLEPYNVNVNSLAASTITFISDDSFRVDLVYVRSEDININDSVIVSDTIGCQSVFPLNVINPCEGFNLNDVEIQVVRNQTTGYVSYRVDSLNRDDYTYEWSYNEDVFTLSTNTDTEYIIGLTQHTQSPGETISVIIRNEDGCEVTRSTAARLSTVTVNNVNLVSILNPNNDSVYKGVTVLSGASSIGNIDWTTVEFVNAPDTFLFSSFTRTLTFISDSPVPEQNIQYTVKNVNGLRSSTGIISLSYDFAGLSSVPTQTILVADGLDIITTQLDDLITDGNVNLNTVQVVSSLTDVHASIVGNVLTIDMTGETSGVVGISANNITGGPLQVGIFPVIREVSLYVVPSVRLNKACTDLIIPVTALDSSATSITSVSGTGVTITDPTTLTVTASGNYLVQVMNDLNQTGEVELTACDGCASTIDVSTCETTVTPYNYITAAPNGTWTNPSGGAAPLTYNGDISFSVNSHTLIYNAPGFEQCPTVSYTINFNITASTLINNNDCGTAENIGTVSNATNIFELKEISDDCINLTTFSGNDGNLVATTYDQWYELTSVASGGGTTTLTVTITGTSQTPLQAPKAQLWSDCSTPLVSTNSNSLNSVTMVYTQPTVGIQNFFLQVFSDYTGTYSINVSQTTT
jgi:hypothetical protein